MAQLEHIVSVHVLGRFVESGSREVTNNGAMVLAKEIVSSLPHRHMFRRLDLDEALMIDISYKAVIPLFTYNPEPPIGNQYSSVGHITRLLFSDINLVIGASDLIKRCSKTLVRLTFMLCDYDVFKEIVYDYTDDPIVLKKKGRPVVYANLHSIHGALNRRNGSSEAYVVSGMTFPKLEFFHEVIEYSWQGMMGVVPHLLANVLLGSDLPRLKVIRLRTAQTMVLEARKLPSLEYVSYYQHSKEVRSISGTKIAAQLFRLLSIKRLQFLRFHDQMPPIRLDSIPSIQCLDLRYMDLGVMILSLTTVVRLLRSLLHLHTAAFAVNNYWAQISLGDNQRLSDSLERLSLYVIGSDLTADDGYTSSEEIISRLPNLYILSLQSEAEKTQRFFENTKNRFSWSQKVAERLRITQEDLFSRINK
ncbi:hypothetical protein FB639_000189 [Coemansia asiatica]|nr:hypothetical protein FB639_000189 [Coemansia asiatica]